jgi:hypothetical protein
VLDNIPGTLTSTELGYVDGVTSAIQTQLNTKLATADTLTLTSLSVMLLPDTVQKTTAFTLALTDAGKDIYVVKGTVIPITIPTNTTAAIPIGTTINFFQGGAGLLVFKKASGVVLRSLNDSIATDGIWSVASLKKRGVNNWWLYGAIQN